MRSLATHVGTFMRTIKGNGVCTKATLAKRGDVLIAVYTEIQKRSGTKDNLQY